ncbi:MAG TPA: phospholipase D-like domain-containing protein [Caulobacteraceae bacterium]|jgi:phosphatidylserine/phosphatidylglycerophosphate/cardiolipin synthase-like enzyme
MTLFSPVDNVTLADLEPLLYAVPIGASAADSPRFAGEPIWWMKIRPGAQAQVFATGARRVFSTLSPGLPGGGSTLSSAVIEITPMPRPNSALLGRLTGGAAVQYVLINHDDLNLGHVATPDLQICVAGGVALVTAGSAGAWIGFARQDRICRDQRAWVDELDAAAGADVDPSWTAYGDRVRALAPATVRLVDHRGRPLSEGSFTVTPASGPAQTVTLSGPSGDTGVVLTGAGQVACASDGVNTILASTRTDTGALGAPVAVSPTDRQLALLKLDLWLPARTPGVTGFQRWTRGNQVEPIVDGMAYFARLVPDLRAAKQGGAVGLAGWAFVKEAFYDPTKVWSLLPEDNSTELVALMHELKSDGAQVRLLVNQFLQLSDADLDALRADLAVALLLLFMLQQGAAALHKLSLDPAGWVAAGFGAAIVNLLPDSTMFEAIRHFAEPSKSAVDAINANDPGVACWTPYPATLADNPLADNPLHIAGVAITALTHAGVYHEKIAAMQAAGQPPIAYVGGIDLNSDRLDTPNHRAYAPFHDVQVRLTGPSVAEVVTSFAERATVAGTTNPLVLPSDPLPDTGHHIVQLGRTRFAPGGGVGEGPAFPSAPAGEDTTYRAILAAIDAAQDYIYIEEQYFTPDDDYVSHLVAAGARTPPIQALVITLPDQTTQPYGAQRRGEIIAKLATTWGDRLRVGAPIRRYLNPTPQLFGGLGRMVLRAAMTIDDTAAVVGPAERLPAVPFWAFVESELVYVDGVTPGGPGEGPIGEQDPDSPDSPTQTWQSVTLQRAPLGQDPRWGAKPDKHDKNSCVLAVQLPGIYVHAKLMVVDDIFMSVGSANLNRRGFFHDGEMNVFAVPEHLRRDPANPALRLRCQLWAEHFGLPVEMGLSLLADPVSALSFFDRSWYRGSHWLPLQFGSSTEPPAVILSIPSNIPAALFDVAKDVVTVAQEPTIWATIVDPTTALDAHIGPGDRGPDL